MSARNEAVQQALNLVTRHHVALASSPEGITEATVRLLADRQMLTTPEVQQEALDNSVALYKSFEVTAAGKLTATNRYASVLQRVVSVLLAQVAEVSELAAVKKTVKGRTLLEQAASAKVVYQRAGDEFTHGPASSPGYDWKAHVRAEAFREAADTLAAPVPPVTAGPRTERERGRMEAVTELRAMATPAPAPVESAGDETGEAERLLAELKRVRGELKRYVGAEPTIAEEMAYISSCLIAVQDVLNDADLAGARTLSVATVRQAADGERPDNPADRRHRLYIDGSGNGWITQSVTSDGTHWIGRIGDAALEATTDAVRAETGGLREIGRCW